MDEVWGRVDIVTLYQILSLQQYEYEKFSAMPILIMRKYLTLQGMRTDTKLLMPKCYFQKESIEVR